MKFVLSLFVCFILLNADSELGFEPFEVHLPRDLRYLNLNNKQQKEIEAILVNYKSEIFKFNLKKREIAKEIKKNFLNKNFNKDEFINSSYTIYAISSEVEAKTLDDIHKILTPKQRELFTFYIEDWKVD